MESTQLMHEGINTIIELANGKLIPIMLISFGCAIVARLVLFYTIRREEWIIKEFEKRVEEDLKSKMPVESFNSYTEKTLNKTLHDLFVVRSAMKRRKPDIIMTLTDRLFMIEKGAHKFVSDLIHRLSFYNNKDENYLRESTINSFERNESFSKSFGLVSNTFINNTLSIMPSIFITCGIFGTFIGIMAALPGLTGMDFSDPKVATMAMDKFLYRITFSMSTSIVGIILSVFMNLLNTAFQVESVYVKTVDKCVATLKLINAADKKEYIEINQDEKERESNLNVA